MELEHKRRANDLFLIVRRNVAVFYPLLPVADRCVQKALTQRRQGLLNWGAPREHQVPTFGESERATGKVREGNISRQTQGRCESFEADVIRSLDPFRGVLGPPEARLTLHSNSRSTVERFDDAHELCGPEEPVVLEKAWCEIGYPKCAFLGLERGLEDIRIRQIALCSRPASRRSDEESPSLFVE